MRAYNYAEANELLKTSRTKPDLSRVLSANTKLVKYESTSSICVELHGAPVVILNRDKSIFVAHCDYKTKTTKDRINQYLSACKLNIKVVQKKNKWYFWNIETNEEFDFGVGAAFSSEGKLMSRS